MIRPLLRMLTHRLNLAPCQSLSIQGMQIVQVLSPISTSKHIHFLPLRDIIGGMHIAGSGRRALDGGLMPSQRLSAIRNVQHVHIRGCQRSCSQPTSHNDNPCRFFIVRIGRQRRGMTVPSGRSCSSDDNGSVRSVVDEFMIVCPNMVRTNPSFFGDRI